MKTTCCINPLTMTKSLTAVATLAGLLSVAPLTFASPPYHPDFVSGGNKWSFRSYDDASVDQTQLVSAQTICFEYDGVSGNHQRYTWYSETFPGWSGKAVQEGDLLYMYGDFAGGLGHSSLQMETLVSPPIYGSSGTWQEWRQNVSGGVTTSTTVSFAKTRSLREGNCTLTAIEAANLPPLLTGSPVLTDVVP